MFLLFCVPSSAQITVDATEQDSFPLEADLFVGIDSFENVYYAKDNVLYKKQGETTINYTNYQLGNLSSVDILNPLEITLFYDDFNTVVQLDNTLNEINRIDFNNLASFRNLQFATTAINKSLWVFNVDNQLLEVYDFLRRNSVFINQPISQSVIAQTSNYNFCWLMTKDHVYKFNIYGSLINEFPNVQYQWVDEDNGNLVLGNDEGLFYLERNTINPIKIQLDEMQIKQLHLKEESLYIYDGSQVTRFQLKLSKKQ